MDKNMMIYSDQINLYEIWKNIVVVMHFGLVERVENAKRQYKGTLYRTRKSTQEHELC